MKTLSKIIISVAGAAAIFFFISFSNHLSLSSPANIASNAINGISQILKGQGSVASSTDETGDIGNQQPLADPPTVLKGVYSTGWSAGSARSINYLVNFIKQSGFNAIVIDIKDYSGYLSYRINEPDFNADGANNQIKIAQINRLIKALHDQNIYVIGRITVFQDPVLAKAHPEWALYNKTTGATWLDDNKLAWMDPASQEVWNYNVEIAKDALSRGFDEINFDYVRFASDGDLNNISYPFWNGKTPKAEIIKDFFAYLRKELPDARLSADLFGLTTINHDDLGIGQIIENAFPYFNYIDPMVYPSHYASGFLGYKNPALYPYEVIRYSLDHALARLKEYEIKEADSTSSTSTPSNNLPQEKIPQEYSTGSTPIRAKIRPWLQDFNLGATYDASMVSKEVNAVKDTFATSSDDFGGFLMWSPSNIYTQGVFNNSTSN
ncbi:putative glycoside hydrolase [Patescibacteria group bacterium]|nr:putative glycoside hydrolase [Patescibacteria group bacterium]MCL5733534.1 putative glycoside hydrolase [Patescibacteria group bacterium]